MTSKRRPGISIPCSSTALWDVKCWDKDAQPWRMTSNALIEEPAQIAEEEGFTAAALTWEVMQFYVKARDGSPPSVPLGGFCGGGFKGPMGLS